MRWILTTDAVFGPHADLWRYDDIKDKFARYCGKIFDSHRIEKIINRVDKLDQDPNISELMQLCSVK